jgi:hypothetical protein
MKISRTTMVLGLAIPLAAVIYAAATAVQVTRVPDETDWRAAADVVRRGWKDGDLVAFSPQWAQGASPWLRGLNVDTAENPDWYEASMARRVWIIGSMNGLGEAAPEGWTLTRDIPLHRTDVRLWTPPGDRTMAYSFSDHISDAKVSRIRGKARQFCTNFKKSRWFCGAEHPWQYVGLETRDIAGRERDVIWAHAIDRATVESAWPAVPRGGTLTIHYGLTQRAAEAREGADVKFQVLVDGRVTVEDTLETGEHGWFRKDIELPGTGTSNVSVRISTSNPQSRQVCFTADLWKQSTPVE